MQQLDDACIGKARVEQREHVRLVERAVAAQELHERRQRAPIGVEAIIDEQRDRVGPCVDRGLQVARFEQRPEHLARHLTHGVRVVARDEPVDVADDGRAALVEGERALAAALRIELQGTACQLEHELAERLRGRHLGATAVGQRGVTVAVFVHHAVAVVIGMVEATLFGPRVAVPLDGGAVGPERAARAIAVAIGVVTAGRRRAVVGRLVAVRNVGRSARRVSILLGVARPARHARPGAPIASEESARRKHHTPARPHWLLRFQRTYECPPPNPWKWNGPLSVQITQYRSVHKHKTRVKRRVGAV